MGDAAIIWPLRVFLHTYSTALRYRHLPQSSTIEAIPYFGQFESSEVVEQFFDGTLTAKNDPKWQNSGASSPDEYEWWAWHICGMACLKMALAHHSGHAIPTVTLAKRCEELGGYVRHHGTIDPKGLRYAGLCNMAHSDFGWHAVICSPMSLTDIAYAIAHKRYVIASVHPEIYQSSSTPTHKGGHLILVVGYSLKDHALLYSDPWGRPGKQHYVSIAIDDFERFFANRGIILVPQD